MTLAGKSVRPLKIAFVIDDTLDKPDGVQQYVLALGAWMSGQGHTVHYLAGASSRQDVAHIHSLSRNVGVKFNGNRLSIPLPARANAIRTLLKAEQYDVIHVQMPYSPMLAHKIIKAADRTTVVVGTFHIMPHGPVAVAGTHLLGRWTAGTLKRFDAIFAVSDVARQFAQKAFRLRDVRVSPNVVEVSRFAKAKPRTDVTSSHVPTILFLGRLVPRKGCATLLDAAAELQKRRGSKPFQVLICGKGSLREKLEQQAKRLGIDKSVRFTGFVDEADKPSYLASADIAVFPSVGGESFGIVLIEAMATGKPVVLAGDNPGYRSVLGDRPELLFKPGNAVQLADKLEHFLQDDIARSQALAWQNDHVGQFDVPTVGRTLLATYAKLHSRSRS